MTDETPAPPVTIGPETILSRPLSINRLEHYFHIDHRKLSDIIRQLPGSRAIDAYWQVPMVFMPIQFWIDENLITVEAPTPKLGESGEGRVSDAKEAVDADPTMPENKHRDQPDQTAREAKSN